MAGENLLHAIKSVADNAIPYTELTNALYGEVLSIEPLMIRIENRFEVSEEDGNLQVSPLCMENYIYFPKHHHETLQAKTETASGPDAHVHSINPIQTTDDHEHILLWRGLLAGDKVLVLRVARGQEYVVLYRIENYSRDEPIEDGGGYR